MSSDNLNRRYKRIVSDKRNAEILRWILLVLLLGLIVSISLVSSSLQEQNDKYWIELTSLVIIIIALAVLARKQKDFVIDKKRDQFFTFYGAYQTLEDYKEEKNERTRRKAQNKIKELSSHVGQWIKWNAPQIFRNEFIDCMYNNLGKAVKFVEQGKIEELSLLIEKLHQISEIILSREPSLEEWKDFNNSMASLEISPEKNPSKRVGFFSKAPVLKYVLIGPLAGIVIAPILNYEGMKPADALLGSVIVAFTAMGAIAAIAALAQRQAKG